MHNQAFNTEPACRLGCAGDPALGVVCEGLRNYYIVKVKDSVKDIFLHEVRRDFISAASLVTMVFVRASLFS